MLRYFSSTTVFSLDSWYVFNVHGSLTYIQDGVKTLLMLFHRNFHSKVFFSNCFIQHTDRYTDFTYTFWNPQYCADLL